MSDAIYGNNVTGKTKQDGEGGARGPAVRRAAGVRGVRQRRARAGVAAEEHRDEASNDEAEEAPAVELPDAGKVGAKKRAKLEAKAERKAQREIGAKFSQSRSLQFEEYRLSINRIVQFES